jgi:hypothetical protein
MTARARCGHGKRCAGAGMACTCGDGCRCGLGCGKPEHVRVRFLRISEHNPGNHNIYGLWIPEPVGQQCAARDGDGMQQAVPVSTGRYQPVLSFKRRVAGCGLWGGKPKVPVACRLRAREEARDKAREEAREEARDRRIRVSKGYKRVRSLSLENDNFDSSFFSFSLRDLRIVRGLCHASVVAALTRPSYLPPGLTRADHSSHDTANPSAQLPRCSLLSTSKNFFSPTHQPSLLKTPLPALLNLASPLLSIPIRCKPIVRLCSVLHTLTILPIPAASVTIRCKPIERSSFPLL